MVDRLSEYSVAGSTVRFDQSAALLPILHQTFFNPLDDHYGPNCLTAACRGHAQCCGELEQVSSRQCGSPFGRAGLQGVRAGPFQRQ
jgi:hypothetical protein